MALNQGLSRPPTRKRRVPTLVIVALAAAMLIPSIIAGYRWEMTGFGGSEVVKETTRYDSTDPGQPKEQGFERTVEKQNPRTIWDWIGLLGVGSAIALVGWVFARKQRERDEAIANDRAQEETLQAYLDQMSNLMIDQKLGKEREDSLEDAVRKVAQARTITTLLVLDKDHKRRCLKLVYELGLIKRPKPMIALNNAGLDRAELGELSLRDAYLRRVDLRATDLSGADLNGSDLSEVDLRGADLRNADLSFTNLTDANLLPYDERHPAGLSFHNLKDKAAGSSDAELRYAKLKSYLIPANPSNTNLEGADLSGTLLGNTDLRRARGLKQEQLERAIGNQATQLPDGLRRPEAWNKPIEDQLETRNEQKERVEAHL